MADIISTYHYYYSKKECFVDVWLVFDQTLKKHWQEQHDEYGECKRMLLNASACA